MFLGHFGLGFAGKRLAPALYRLRRMSPGGDGPATEGRPSAEGDGVRRTAATQPRPYDRDWMDDL